MESHAKVDGKDLSPGTWSQFLVFSHDSKSYVFLRIGKTGKKQVVVNGKPVGPWVDQIDNINVTSLFSPDSKHFCYATRYPGHIILDGRKTVPRHGGIISDVAWHKGYITYWVTDHPREKDSSDVDPGSTLKFIRCKIP